jgi:hypothetical protein
LLGPHAAPSTNIPTIAFDKAPSRLRAEETYASHLPFDNHEQWSAAVAHERAQRQFLVGKYPNVHTPCGAQHATA